LVIRARARWPGAWWSWALPAIWFGWQLLSATHSMDSTLTAATLWHLGACLACYFVGAWVFACGQGLRWLLIGVLAAFSFCLVRAVDQRLVEFPQEHKALLEGASVGWTNFPPEVVAQMRTDQMIITTNGVEIANPIFIEKLAKGRVHGTLVYPNALAGIVLLLLPVSIVLAWNNTRHFRPLTRMGVIALTLFLGFAGFFWTGSKSGWLIAMGVGAVWLLRLNWPRRWKWAAVALMAAAGLVVFGARFHNYFAAGATSMGARFDYWRAAVKITRDHPLFGTGPGAFQRPYQRMKSPDAEMARLTHNDYLEQFCDSGVPGGVTYAAWIGLLFATLTRRLWQKSNPVVFAIFIGALGWFVQGFSEFGLYIPALAWPAFCLVGWLLGGTSNQIDSTVASG
jgi:hypothetical protein